MWPAIQSVEGMWSSSLAFKKPGVFRLVGGGILSFFRLRFWRQGTHPVHFRTKRAKSVSPPYKPAAYLHSSARSSFFSPSQRSTGRHARPLLKIVSFPTSNILCNSLCRVVLYRNRLSLPLLSPSSPSTSFSFCEPRYTIYDLSI